MSLDTLLPLVQKSGSKLSPSEFQYAVNVAFHDIEAEHYDALHANMWESLEQQIALLVADVLEKTQLQTNLKLLDIGSGTGLSTELLLESKLGKHIGHITLLDTSAKMLEKAEHKIKKRNIDLMTVNADVSALVEKYDVIIISSVLHHIPDLKEFLKKVDSVLNSGGVLIHLQDPNGDFMNDAEYLSREKEYRNKLNDAASEKKMTDFIPKTLKRTLKRMLGNKDYIDLVNDQLLKNKVTNKRMTADEIWSVTDIHVGNLPFSIGGGISVKMLQENLSDYTLLKVHSYAFYGFLKSELLAEFQPKEEHLIASGAQNGCYVSATWIKK